MGIGDVNRTISLIDGDFECNGDVSIVISSAGYPVQSVRSLVVVLKPHTNGFGGCHAKVKAQRRRAAN
jgi:hypothetical protein